MEAIKKYRKNNHLKTALSIVGLLSIALVALCLFLNTILTLLVLKIWLFLGLGILGGALAFWLILYTCIDSNRENTLLVLLIGLLLFGGGLSVAIMFFPPIVIWFAGPWFGYILLSMSLFLLVCYISDFINFLRKTVFGKLLSVACLCITVGLLIAALITSMMALYFVCGGLLLVGLGLSYYFFIRTPYRLVVEEQRGKIIDAEFCVRGLVRRYENFHEKIVKQLDSLGGYHVYFMEVKEKPTLNRVKETYPDKIPCILEFENNYYVFGWNKAGKICGPKVVSEKDKLIYGNLKFPSEMSELTADSYRIRKNITSNGYHVPLLLKTEDSCWKKFIGEEAMSSVEEAYNKVKQAIEQDNEDYYSDLNELMQKAGELSEDKLKNLEQKRAEKEKVIKEQIRTLSSAYVSFVTKLLNYYFFTIIPREGDWFCREDNWIFLQDIKAYTNFVNAYNKFVDQYNQAFFFFCNYSKDKNALIKEYEIITGRPLDNNEVDNKDEKTENGKSALSLQRGDFNDSYLKFLALVSEACQIIATWETMSIFKTNTAGGGDRLKSLSSDIEKEAKKIAELLPTSQEDAATALTKAGRIINSYKYKIPSGSYNEKYKELRSRDKNTAEVYTPSQEFEEKRVSAVPLEPLQEDIDLQPDGQQAQENTPLLNKQTVTNSTEVN